MRFVAFTLQIQFARNCVMEVYDKDFDSGPGHNVAAWGLAICRFGTEYKMNAEQGSFTYIQIITYSSSRIPGYIFRRFHMQNRKTNEKYLFLFHSYFLGKLKIPLC